MVPAPSSLPNKVGKCIMFCLRKPYKPLRALRHDLKPLRGFLAQYAQDRAAAPQAIRDALRKRAAEKQVVFRSSRQDSTN